MNTTQLTQLLISWLVMSVSFFIVSKLPIGVEISSFQKSYDFGGGFWVVKCFRAVAFELLTLPIVWLTFGLFTIVINAIIFGIAAWLVEGFWLRWGIWSALLGAIALGFINSLLYQLLGSVR